MASTVLCVPWPETGSEMEEDAQHVHHLVKIPAFSEILLTCFSWFCKSEVPPGCQGIRISPWHHSSSA